MAVTEQLNLDVPRFFDKLFNEDAVIAKTVARLIAAAAETLKRLFVVVGHAQALAAAARAGLDHHRVTNALGNLDGALSGFNRVIDTRDAIDAGCSRQFFRFDLVAHGGD